MYNESGSEELVQIIRVISESVDLAFKIGKVPLSVLQLTLKGLLTVNDWYTNKELMAPGNMRNVSKFLNNCNGVQVFQIRETSENGKKNDYLKLFEKEAKRYGLKYCKLRDLNKEDGYKEILVDNADVALVNAILQKHDNFGKEYSMEEYADNAKTEEIDKMNEDLEEKFERQKKDTPSKEKEEKLGKFDVSEEKVEEIKVRSTIINNRNSKELKEITINKGNVERQNEMEYFVRIPGTQGREYQKIPIEGTYWNNDTLVAFIDMNQEQTVYNREGRAIKKVPFSELYRKHWVPEPNLILKPNSFYQKNHKKKEKIGTQKAMLNKR